MSLRSIIVTASILAVALPVRPQPGGREKWHEVRSASSTVWSGASLSKTREMARGIERLRQVMEVLGSANTKGAPPMTLIVFRNEPSFRPYMRRPPARGIRRSWESYYARDRAWVLLDGSLPTAEAMPWVYQAYASHSMAQSSSRYPYWLRSGLTEFYGTIEIEKNGDVRIGRPPRQALTDIRQMSFMPIDALFGVTRHSAMLRNPERLRLFNAQAWGVTHYLMTGGGEGPAVGAKFFNRLLSGTDPETAIREVWGTGIAGFESRLRAYLNSPQMPVFTLSSEILYEVELAERRMGIDEISLELANYLVTAHDPLPVERVEAHLLPLRDSAVLGADAVVALGRLRHRSDRTREADELFREALERGPTRAGSYYAIAEFFRDGPRSNEKRGLVRRAAAAALEIDPTLLAAEELLISSYLDTGETEPALAHLRRAVELAPGRSDLVSALRRLESSEAGALMRTVSQREEAELEGELLKDAVAPGPPPEVEDGSIDSGRKLVDGYATEYSPTRRVIEQLRATLAETSDPAERQEIQTMIDDLEASVQRGMAVDLYNAAVEEFNRGEFESAKSKFQRVIETAGNPELEEAARQALEAIPDGP